MATLYFQPKTDRNEAWCHATEPREDEPQDAYIRGTGARSALNGICSATGYQPDVQFLKHLRRQREEYSRRSS